jgi:hypothetical protein
MPASRRSIARRTRKPARRATNFHLILIPKTRNEEKLKAILQTHPWFDHVFLFDSKDPKKSTIVEAQPGAKEEQVKGWGMMYTTWLSLEGPYLAEQVERKPKPMVWYSGESRETEAPRYFTTAIFSVPGMTCSKDRIVLGGAAFRRRLLERQVLSQSFSRTFTSQKFDEYQGESRRTDVP